MKAATLKKPGGLENIRIVERDAPETAGPGELLVKVAANSLNYHDYVVAIGGIPTEDGRVLMSDGSGEVVAVGEGVTGWKVGDHAVSVFFPNWPDGEGLSERRHGVPGDSAEGFAAEYVAKPASAFTRIPKGYNLAEAATLPCAALTAWRALFVATTTKPGDIVLVQGTGGVSIFALQFAKAAGATVIATSSSGEKLERLKDLGADHLINYREAPEWGRAALQWTGGRGVDKIVEVGGPGTLEQSIFAARTGGHIGLIGVLTGTAGEVPTAIFMFKNLVLTGITVGSHADQRDMIEAIEGNGIRPVIDSHFPLEQLADAYAHQAAQKHFGKIILDIQG
jgi:NADPH:quinone reductase-like Zn-dependent oxidoreductase